MARLKRRDTVDALSPNASGTGLGAPVVFARGQAAEHFVPQAGVEGRGACSCSQVATAPPIAPDRAPAAPGSDLLVGQVDRPGLGRPPDVPGPSAVAHMPFAAEPRESACSFMCTFSSATGISTWTGAIRVSRCGAAVVVGTGTKPTWFFSANPSYFARHE